MENYEQKYKEALERAKSFNKRWQNIQATDSELALKELKEIFPELKESEDERIRKAIIEHFAGSHSSMYPYKGFTKEQIVAYLEKQGEQKPDFCHHEVDLSNCSEEYRKAYYDGWNNCNQQHAQLEAEQKPSWSEEDEKRFEYCKRLVYASDKYSVEDREETVDWLKSIKDRVQPQPKQEWSEEDEHCVELLLPIIDSSSLIPKNRKKCKEFLKSIKPNHWKPSEEQMEALWDIIPHLPNCKEDVDKDTLYRCKNKRYKKY